MQFEIEFEASHLDRMMEAIRREIATPEEMLGSIGESLLRVNRRRHEAGVDPEGKDWKALSPLTLGSAVWKNQDESFRKSKSLSIEAARKIRSKRGGVLKDSGRMLASFNYQVSSDTLVLGFDGPRDAKLAGWHHGGTDPYTILPKDKKALSFAGIITKRVNHPGLPKRELVGFPDSDKNLVENVTADHLLRVLQRVR
ncbi:phage virion morphogenesis protein [Methylomonas sp. BW4-1]|uniref:phage virion morphogenesis protein n=1 Tax=Methylomonas sp. BW4-1 TaxID=3376685 RepID=UPI004042720A